MEGEAAMNTCVCVCVSVFRRASQLASKALFLDMNKCCDPLPSLSTGWRLADFTAEETLIWGGGEGINSGEKGW